MNFNIKIDGIKRCSKGRICSLKSIFYEKSRSKDGLTPHCKPCRKKYRKKIYFELYDLEIKRRKKYRVDNKVKK